MYSNINEDAEVEKRTRGWNLRALKGKPKDKSSAKFKQWFQRHRESKSKIIRKKYETLAKAPLPGRVYKPQVHRKYERRKKGTANSPTNLGVKKNILGDVIQSTTQVYFKRLRGHLQSDHDR